MKICLTILLTWVCILSGHLSAASQHPHPNIVYILADDLGYGDVKYLNPKGKIPTPQMD